MGKSTISMAIFHCFLYVHQRIYGPTKIPRNSFLGVPKKKKGNSHQMGLSENGVYATALCQVRHYDHMFDHLPLTAIHMAQEGPLFLE